MQRWVQFEKIQWLEDMLCDVQDGACLNEGEEIIERLTRGNNSGSGRMEKPERGQVFLGHSDRSRASSRPDSGTPRNISSNMC